MKEMKEMKCNELCKGYYIVFTSIHVVAAGLLVCDSQWLSGDFCSWGGAAYSAPGRQFWRGANSKEDAS